MKQVLLVSNTLGKPFGHPIYDPIYRAASEHGKQVAIHAGGEAGVKGRDAAGGQIANMLERYEIFQQPAMHYLTSMITHGLFEKFPDVKVMFTEFGFTWLPSLMWRLDANTRLLKAECPWVKSAPSDYVHRNVRFSTQPIDSAAPAALRHLVSSYDGMQDIICFSTDYPHWDADDPTQAASHLPHEWREKVFWNNAAAFYGYPQLGEEHEVASPTTSRRSEPCE
jgi:predicted TIM-barrel fold metal-dependent hydrolase